MTPTMISILIGDDHRIVREGLKQVLADAPEMRVIAEAQTGPEVIVKVQQLFEAAVRLDVVLPDIALPERDGLAVLQQLRKSWLPLPVLMLSTYPEKQYAVRCIKLGAAGYLSKSADPGDMISAVRKVAVGGRYVTPATAEALANGIGNAPGKGSAKPDNLSHREHQVFCLLVSGQSVSEIGAQLGLVPNTGSTYRARILAKNGAKNDDALALYAERLAKSDAAV